MDAEVGVEGTRGNLLAPRAAGRQAVRDFAAVLLPPTMLYGKILCNASAIILTGIARSCQQ